MKNIVKNIKNQKQALPYRGYLEALVLSSFQVSEIAEQIRAHGLTPFPTNLELEIRYILLEYEEEFGKDSTKYPKGIKSLMMYVQNLPGGSPTLSLTFELLSDIVLKRWIQSMLMGNIDLSVVYVLTSAKTDVVYEESVYHEFQTYFFNLSDFSVKDKYNLVEQETDAQLKKLYQLAVNYDKDELLWEMGFVPEMPLDYIIKSVATESLMRFKKTKDDDKAARLGTLVLRAAEKLKEMGEDKEKDFSRAAGFDFKVLGDKPVYRTVKDLEKEE